MGSGERLRLDLALALVGPGRTAAAALRAVDYVLGLSGLDLDSPALTAGDAAEVADAASDILRSGAARHRPGGGRTGRAAT